jgi:prepilin-type N-terminal cleavage/methylation domain-containing protein
MSAPITDDRGTTLVEVLIAVFILGITAVAVVGGLFTSITISDVHRKQATAGAVARDYTERIAGETYVECAGPGTYALAPAAVPVPSGYSAVIAVEYWSGGTWGTTCASTGLQRVTVTVTSDDDRAKERSVVVVRQQ